MNASANLEKAKYFFPSNPNEFRDRFGRLPFALSHRLHETDLFSLPRLDAAAAKAVAATKAKGNAKFVNKDGLSRVSAKFHEAAQRDQVEGAVLGLKESGAWMKISNICAVDSAYRDLLNDILADIELWSGVPVRRSIVWTQMTVFMASPNVVTPYHIDHEQNFLCQISGEKDIALFPPDDRELLPDVEIERFYTGEINAATWRENLHSRGAIHHLKPGVAVHLPSLGGHWVRNGPDVSISVSINFCTKQTDRRAHIYQMNHYIRKVGLVPRSPGASLFGDTLKAAFLGMLTRRKVRCYEDAVFSGIDRLRAIFSPILRLRHG
jgi:Cupin-like domain